MLKHIVGTFLALFFISQSAFAATPVVQDTYAPTVQIRQGKSAGSGTVIFSFGKTFVLTNFHVVSAIKKDAVTSNSVRFEDIDVLSFKYGNIDNIQKTKFQGKVVLFNQKMDLALLEVIGAVALPVARIDCKIHPDLGDNVFAIGGGLGHTPFLTAGILSQSDPIDGYPYYLSTSPIVPGNSGGGLYIKCGDNLSRYCLIGVPSRVLTMDQGRVPISHMGFSIRLDTVAKFLENSQFEYIIHVRPGMRTETPKTELSDKATGPEDADSEEDDDAEEETK